MKRISSYSHLGLHITIKKSQRDREDSNWWQLHLPDMITRGLLEERSLAVYVQESEAKGGDGKLLLKTVITGADTVSHLP